MEGWNNVIMLAKRDVLWHAASLLSNMPPTDDLASPMPCRRCGAAHLRGTKVTPQSVMLRCPRCGDVQTIPERRAAPRPGPRVTSFPALDRRHDGADDLS